MKVIRRREEGAREEHDPRKAGLGDTCGFCLERVSGCWAIESEGQVLGCPCGDQLWHQIPRVSRVPLPTLGPHCHVWAQTQGMACHVLQLSLPPLDNQSFHARSRGAWGSSAQHALGARHHHGLQGPQQWDPDDQKYPLLSGGPYTLHSSVPEDSGMSPPPSFLVTQAPRCLRLDPSGPAPCSPHPLNLGARQPQPQVSVLPWWLIQDFRCHRLNVCIPRNSCVETKSPVYLEVGHLGGQVTRLEPSKMV